MEEFNSYKTYLRNNLDTPTARPIDAHIVLVKTANNPTLLERCLESVHDCVERTYSGDGDIVVGVLDDSSEHEVRERNAGVCTRFPIVSEYLSSDTRASSLTAKMISTLQQADPYYLVAGLGLTTELMHQEWKLCDSSRRLSSEYRLGGGPISTSNIAALLAAYIAGKHNFQLENTLFTHTDDDIVYATIGANNQGLPVLVEHDFFSEREEIFSEPRVAISGGKYLGVKGSPAGVIESTAHVVTGIIENNRSFVPENAVSPYPVFNPQDFTFSRRSVREMYAMIPEIIENGILRIPTVGMVLPSGLDSYLDNHNFRYDQGNYTVRGSTLRLTPFPSAGVPEYLVINMLKEIYPDSEDYEKAVQIETGIFHHRTNAADGRFGPLTNMVNKQSVIQLGLEASSLTLGVPHRASFYRNKLQTLKRLETLSQYLSLKSVELQSKNDTQSYLNQKAIMRLLEQISLPQLTAIRNEIEENFAAPKNRLRALKGARRFTRFARVWPGIMDKVYQLGFRSDNTVRC